MSGIRTAIAIARISMLNANATVHGFLVLPVPSTNVWSNITVSLPLTGKINFRAEHSEGVPRCRGYFTFAVPLRTLPRGAGVTATGTAPLGPLDFRLSRKFCQNIRIGLAMKIEE